MRELRTNTAVIISVGPFYDKTDGVTIETALTITNERITLVADTDDNAAPTNVLDNVTGATSGTSNDLNYITGNDAGIMQMELSAANTNRLGRMLLSITDAANHVPVFHEFMVLTADEYDRKYAVTGPCGDMGIVDRGTAQSATGTTLVLRAANVHADDTLIGCIVGAYGATQAYWQYRVITDHVLSTDTVTVDQWTVTPSGTITYAIFAGAPGSTSSPMPVNVVQISDDATAAANLESFMDGTGYAGTGNVIPTVTTTATATAVTTVNGLAAGVITAASIAADAITDAKVASDVTIASVTGAVGSVTGAVGSVTALAANSMTASALATDAVTEITDAIFARAFSAAYGSYTFDQLVKMIASVLLGKASGLATTTAVYRNLADNADVITATVDADGNRTAVTKAP